MPNLPENPSLDHLRRQARTSFDATALGWAEHNHQEATAALLRPVTQAAASP
jgi:hypothetical protein